MNVGERKSALTGVTIAKVVELEKAMSKFGWKSNRQMNIERHIRKLDESGYKIHDAAREILREFAGLKTRVRRLDQFAGFSDSSRQTPVSCLVSERVLFSSYTFCHYGKKDEGSKITEYFQSTFETDVVRVGMSKRASMRSSGEIAGSSLLGIIFASSDGKIFELVEVGGGCQLGVCSNLGDFLALKCLPLDDLNQPMISKVFYWYPDYGGAVHTQKEEELDQFGRFLGIC